MPAPIVLFVYNRPDHTRMTLESLQKNMLADQSELFIYSDGPKSTATPEQIQQVENVRSVIRENNWCGAVHIIESATNKGLAASIISGVTEIVNKYGKIIVIEDDFILSPGFLTYMNDALTLYEKEEKVMHISGYMFDCSVELPETFFYNTTSCWGWGTWKRSWSFLKTDASELLAEIETNFRLKDFDRGAGYLKQLKSNISGELNTWAIKWYASVFIQHGFCLHPRQSLVRNVGHDGSGVHCDDSLFFHDQSLSVQISVRPIELKENRKAEKEIKKIFDTLYNVPFFSMNHLKNISRKWLPEKFYHYLKNKKNNYLSGRSAL